MIKRSGSKTNNNLSKNVVLIIAIVLGVLIIFSISNYVFPKNNISYSPEDDDKGGGEGEIPSVPECPVWEENRASQISSVMEAYDIVDCIDRDPKSDCQEIHLYDSDNEQMDCSYGHSCCWAVCGTSLFMGDYNFNKASKDKEGDIAKALTSAGVIIWTSQASSYGTCNYEYFKDGKSCADGGCGTCVGGFKRETVFVVSHIAGANGGAQLTGGSERYVITPLGLKDAHSSGSNHYSGEGFDLDGSTFTKLKSDISNLNNKRFFDKYGFVKSGIDCQDEGNHIHCNVNVGEITQVLQCADGYNAYTIEN